MPMPKKMPWLSRLNLARRILLGQFNVIGSTVTQNLEELKLRNRSKEWYKKYDEGKYPFVEAEDETDGRYS